jgi:hypothetical protein
VKVSITDTMTARRCNEGQSVTFQIRVYDDSASPWTLTVPTSIRYRVDNPETGGEVTGWTSINPDDETSLPVANPLTGCQDERRQLVVEVNHGLTTAAVATREWWVRALAGVS